MNTWNWLLHFLIIFDLVAFGIYFGGDILFTAISKVQKKSKKDDDLDLYDFEIETAPQKRSLCVDSIRMLYSGEIDEFVEKELLPDAAETMNALSEAEKTAVSLLLKAYIGFLSEEATVDEQSFPMVKELLSYTQGSKEDGEKDAIDCLMEDTVSRTHRHREYYNNYQRYQLMQVDKERVIMACNIIINDLIGRLYRYDYPHSAAYAREHRELEQYRVSNNANLQCKESIEAAVREHFDGMYLSHDAAKGVIETYGMERVALVLANTVQLQDWDGRYSRRNKEWAKTIPNDNPETVRCGYVLNSHPAVLDGFIDLVREEQQRSRTQGEKLQPSRPSVRDKLKQELPAHKPAAPKKQGPER